MPLQNPNNLVEVEAVLSGHPVPFRDIRAHMLYWLEFQFGTKFARKKAKVLYQKDIEACARNVVQHPHCIALNAPRWD